MKKKIILFILLILIIAGIVAYFIIGNNTVLKINKTNDQEYECKYIVNDNFELNTFKENHTYDITVNNNIVKKVNIYIDYYFNDKESFDRIYSMYNSEKANGYKIEAYDFDSNVLSITKEEKTNTSYKKYLKNNDIDEQYCKLKEESKNTKTYEPNTTDTTYICKHDNLITYLTVDSKKVITSLKNGTIHKMESLEEYNEIKSKLKNTEYIEYLYDEPNLTITLLEKVKLINDMNYDNYIKSSLSGYECEISKD